MRDLKSRDTRDVKFKHGPGAVFEQLTPNQKWVEVSNAVKTAAFDIDAFGYDDLEVQMNDLSERTIVPRISNCALKSAIDHISEETMLFKGGASSRISKLVSVEKNSTSRRTITIEQTLNQFIQQGLNTFLRDSISKCPILSLSLDLTDQSRNQTLALEGSLLDNWATIDLKSASDLLSVKLVEAVFRSSGPFMDHLMDCRSSSVKSDKEATFDLKKFAGMGNALTFPVQSVCFAVVCLACILVTSGKRVSYWNCRRAARHIRVFGDDIIISTRYARQCVHWLHAVGLKVNSKKSFLEGNFKESCGVDAFAGVDITPVYLRYRPDDGSKDPSVIAGLISTSNQAWFEGLYGLSTCLADEVEERLGKRLPFVSVRSGSLGWHCRPDTMTPHKWCYDTHQFLTKADVLVPLRRKDKLDGYAALMKFYHVPLLGRDGKHLLSTPWRFHLRLSKRLVPTVTFPFSDYKSEKSYVDWKGNPSDVDLGWLPINLGSL